MAKSDTDWGEVERRYRAGQDSLRDIAADNGCTEGAIRKRAKVEAWVRAEKAVYRDNAQTVANEQVLAGKAPLLIEHEPRQEKHRTPVTASSLSAVAEAAGMVIASHRRGAAALRALLNDLVVELAAVNADPQFIEEAIIVYYEAKMVAAGTPQARGAIMQRMQMAISSVSIGSRSKIVLNMATALDKLVNVERIAWNLNDGEDDRKYEDILAEVYDKCLNKRIVRHQEKIAA